MCFWQIDELGCGDLNFGNLQIEFGGGRGLQREGGFGSGRVALGMAAGSHDIRIERCRCDGQLWYCGDGCHRGGAPL